jgi:hypothetical protein
MKIKIDMKWPLLLANASMVRLGYKLLEVNGQEFTVDIPTDSIFIEHGDHSRSRAIQLDELPLDWYKKIEDPFAAWLVQHGLETSESRTFTPTGIRRLWDEAREDLKRAILDEAGRKESMPSIGYDTLEEILNYV